MQQSSRFALSTHAGFRSVTVLLCLFFSFAFVLLLPGQSQAMKPLLQEGKTSVYQRVVTHPGARLYQGPEATAEALRDVRTFTVMYIYARQDNRVQVGVNSNKADGWIDANLVTEWPQAITMLFTDRTGRDPVLFFKDHAALEQTCQAESVGGTVKSYLEALKNRQTGNLPVVASEPIESQVAEKNFYLLPVLNIDTKYEGMKLLEVASIDPGKAEAPKSELPKPAASEFKIGFAFVIDTTISMGPYIKQTTELIKRLYNELEKSPYAENMAFAVVAFRSSVKKTPKLGYTARVVCDFTTVKDRARLENALEKVSEATVSSHDINEDSFAGIKEAAESLSWKDYGSRIMLMVSDAGPLKAGDPTSLTGFSPEALSDYLRERKIYLTCVHVKGGKNKKNQDYAAQAYRILTMQSNNQASYIAIEAKDQKHGAQSFHSTAKVLAKSYENLLRATATGQFLTQPKEPEKPRQLSPEEEAERIAQCTGYAMQLQFFGNQKQSQAPQVVKAWIADADLAKLESSQGAPVLACEPAVLLTKKQLDNLYEQLKKLLEASEEAFLNGKTDLFAQIQSASAQMSRDPKQFSLNPGANLIENKLLDEVLVDLPYKSHISGMTQQDWENMSTGERQKLISWLKGLIARYRSYDSDNTHWECFGATNANDCVYRVPLKMLP